jgi:hypothetical protein
MSSLHCKSTLALVVTILLVTASSAFASDSIAPGNYTNSNGCSVHVEESRVPGAMYVQINQPSATGSSTWMVVDLDASKALAFALCVTSSSNEPVSFTKSSGSDTTTYILNCGARLDSDTAEASIVVKSNTQELMSISYSDKVARMTSSGHYIPGTQSLMSDLNCEDLTK